MPLVLAEWNRSAERSNATRAAGVELRGEGITRVAWERETTANGEWRHPTTDDVEMTQVGALRKQ